MDKMKTGITALIIGIIATTGIAFAFGGGFDSETQQAIKNTIEANDYNAWKETMMGTLTEERFNKMVEMHQHMIEMNQRRETMIQALEDGDYETVQELSEQLGLEGGPCRGRMFGSFGKMGGRMGGFIPLEGE